MKATDLVRERAGLAGEIPAVRVEGLGESIAAGLTTRARNFRFAALADDPAVARAYAELDAFAAPFGGWLRVHQVHGARVLSREGSGPGSVTLGKADGLVASPGVRAAGPGARPPAGRLLTVTVADCVPVFLAWPGGYGLLHAGWRGTAAGVLEAGLAASGVAAAALRVHLGPAIGGCCYEVGPEVVDAVYGGLASPGKLAGPAGGALRGVPRHALDGMPGGAAADERKAGPRRAHGDRWRLDLRHALAARAGAAGVDPARISVSTGCTACGEVFHSFRASGERTVKSLMLAFIGAPI